MLKRSPKTKILLGVLLAIVAGVVLGIGAEALGFYSFKFWAPKYADAKREVFENSQSYQHGVVRDLRNLKMEYAKAEAGSTERKIIKSTILHRAAVVDTTKLPADLSGFIQQLQEGQ